MTITRLDTNARMSQAVVHGDTVYLAGQVGAPGESVEVQTKTILKQIDDLLARTGSSKQHLLSATILLADISDFAEVNAIWETWVSDAGVPARATAEAKLVTPDYKVEIIIIAAKA